MFPQEKSEDDAGAEELIEIVHTEEGTSVRIEDVTVLEFAALAVIALAVVSGLYFAWRHRRARARHYSLDDRRRSQDRRLP